MKSGQYGYGGSNGKREPVFVKVRTSSVPKGRLGYAHNEGEYLGMHIRQNQETHNDSEYVAGASLQKKTIA